MAGFEHWALCNLCNGNGCSQCGNTGEVTVWITNPEKGIQ